MQASSLQVAVHRHATQSESLTHFNRVCAGDGHQPLQLFDLFRSQFVRAPANPAFRPRDTEASMDESATACSIERIQPFNDVDQRRRVERAGGLPLAEFELDSSINQTAERFRQLFQRKRQLFETRNDQPVAPSERTHAGQPLRGRAHVGRNVFDINLGAPGAQHGLPLSGQVGRTLNRTRVADFASHGRYQQMTR